MASLDVFYWNLEVFLKICIFGVSGMLLVPSVLSYVRLRSLKLLFISIAFILFFLKGALLVAGLLIPDLVYGESTPLLLLDVGIIGALYAAAAK